MARRQYIYALHDDALGLLEMIESRGPLQYALMGAFGTTDTPVYQAAEELPDLGTTRVASTTGGERYMIFRPAVEVVRREVPQDAGGVLYFVDPWKNSPCIMF